MSALILLCGLLMVFWFALGRPRLRRRSSCGDGRPIGWPGSLVGGAIALALFSRLVERLILVGLVIAAVGFATVVLVLILVLRARR